MTVRELIEMLSECNPDMEIVVNNQGYAMEIEKVDGYEFGDLFAQKSAVPCIGIKTSNCLGYVDDSD